MIQICEVGPRDGLQNEKTFLSVDQKIEMMERAAASGIPKLEAVSFVNRKLVPTMADAEDVMSTWQPRAGVSIAGLALSQSGIARALKTKIDVLHVTMAASDAFNQKNARRTVDEGLQDLLPSVREAASERPTVAVLATSFGCPFSGDVPTDRVFRVCEQFLLSGVKEIVLADTTGMANPMQVKTVVQRFYQQFGTETSLGLHFHNTRGLGLANVVAGYEAGVSHFDSSIGGLGGCPFAPKATGNICTEDLVHLFHEMDIQTGVDLDAVIALAKDVESWMGKALDGLVMKAGKRSELTKA
ncbi:hydroxymethylglutaryl-CoA lyase [Shouchella shacheensis]|uniref:hydroxymethylglutaryl-CoA lyase n=1 Tax=Shouchella shacheensis TaxID=1649580 RepID=UPI00073FD6EA|nr:hydroxymethylglutaryl-CoA lyase [Shouchella shacheensis]